ncbi:MAG: PBSX family phage terminase large subunit [Chloroflexota bacterium]|nr:PBSX family phage terminase large subunit [Chloroflexota bacterium]
MNKYPTFDLSHIKEVTNEKYYPYYWNTDRYFVTYGSAGSGKSHFCAQKIIKRLVEEDVGHRFLVLRKYSPDLELSAFKLIKDYLVKWGLWEFCKVTVKPMHIVFLPNGNEIYFRGLDNLEKIKSIENITGIWYEESTEASHREVLQLDLRLRPKFKKGCKNPKKGAYAQIMFSYNPISKQIWTYKHHHIEGQPSYRKKVTTEIEYGGKIQKITSYMTVLHTTYKDNRFLDPIYVASLEELINKDETFHKIYAKGEYADIKNKIYGNYTVVDQFSEMTPELVWYGLDFGFTHPMALVENRKKGNVRHLKTIFYKSGYDTKQFIEWLDDTNFSKTALIYADSAEPDRIQMLQDAGYNVRPAYKAANSVADGIDYCRTLEVLLLKRDIHLRDEFYSYKYKEDKAGNIVFNEKGKETPAKFKDDLMDAWRYAEYTEFIEGGKVPSCRSIG